MERAWWADLKARLAVCLVAVLLGALLAGLFMWLTTPPFLAAAQPLHCLGRLLGRLLWRSHWFTCQSAGRRC